MLTKLIIVISFEHSRFEHKVAADWLKCVCIKSDLPEEPTDKLLAESLFS